MEIAGLEGFFLKMKMETGRIQFCWYIVPCRIRATHHHIEHPESKFVIR